MIVQVLQGVNTTRMELYTKSYNIMEKMMQEPFAHFPRHIHRGIYPEHYNYIMDTRPFVLYNYNSNTTTPGIRRDLSLL